MSGKQRKNSDKNVNVDDIRKLTEESKSNLEVLYAEACDEAFKVITQDADLKIQDAAKKSRTRAYVYTWEYLEDKNDKTFSFKGVRIMDILTKGRYGDDKQLIEVGMVYRLLKHFNPTQSDDGFRVGWMKFNKHDENDPTQYGVYVSWYKPREQYNH